MVRPRQIGWGNTEILLDEISKQFNRLIRLVGVVANNVSNIINVAPGPVGNVLTSDGTDWTSAAGVGAPTQVTGITLSSGSWTLVAGLYEYDYANANITVNSIVDVIPANADISIVKAAEVLPLTESSAGSVKIYATNAPTGDIGVIINITEKA